MLERVVKVEVGLDDAWGEEALARVQVGFEMLGELGGREGKGSYSGSVLGDQRL